ncbi:MAG: GAP family protein [Solirubrobacterales bacterium]
MVQAIGEVLPLGVGVALSPVPIIGVVLMLGTSRGRSNGPAFLLGWIFGLALAGTAVLLISGGADATERGEPADWLNVVRLLAGLLLLRIAVRQWRGRPREGEEPSLPGWMRSVDRFTMTRSALFGAALSGVNPKNLLLTIGAATAIAQTEVATGRQAIALAVFVAIGTIGVAIPVAAYFAMGERSRRLLEGMKTWMAANNATVIAVICLLIGAKLIGDGIAGF